MIALNEKTGKSVVSSPYILAINGAPMDAKIVKNTDSLLRANWVIKEVKDSKGNQIPAMRYSAVIRKASGGLSYYARAPRYDNELGTTGTCARIK